MKRLYGLAFILMGGLSLAQTESQEITLPVFRFAENRTVKFDLLPTTRVPGASMKAQVKFEEGQFRIEVEYKQMKPAVLFGGDVTCYVLWAVNRDGAVQNLGELWVRPGDENDKVQFSTGLRNFGLLVTAESYFQVPKPSEMIIFLSTGRADPPVSVNPVTFGPLAPAPKYGIGDVGTVRYDGSKPLDLVQAERVYGIAEDLGTEKYAGDLHSQATLALEQATHMYQRGSKEGTQRFARRSVAASNEAISLTSRKLEIEELERQIAQRQSEMQALENRAAQAESRAADAARNAAEVEEKLSSASRELADIQTQKSQLEREKSALQSEMVSLQSEKSRLESEKAGLLREQEALKLSMQELEVEKTDLQGRLQDALSRVADTRESARGYILNLPDILFDVGESTLKADARVALGKLAGILLIMQDLNLRIEGHTDSTGSPSYNLRLSQRRADSVFDFLAGEGISSSRMQTAGYGMERPIADNSTSQGRSQNRRVEVIIAEGTIAEASGAE